MNQYFTSYTPKVRAIIRDAITAETKVDITNDLVSLATNKAYGRAAGTWQLMLPHRQEVTPGNTYLDLIETDDMITIEMDAGNGAGWLPVMLGLVDRISLVKQGGAVPVRQVKVSGQDFGKILVKHDIGLDIIEHHKSMIQNDDSHAVRDISVKSRLLEPSVTMGTPATVIGKIFELCVSDMLQTVGRVAFVSDCADSWATDQPQLMTTHGTSFWAIAGRAKHEPFNILTTDTALGDVRAFNVLLEQLPFDEQGKLSRQASRWRTIDDTEIISEDLGVSDSERVNYVSYQPAWYEQSSLLSFDAMIVHPDFTKYDSASVRQHGLCPKIVRDIFIPPEGFTHIDGKGVTTGWTTAAKKLTENLWNWFKRNHEYESGTMTLHLRPDIRVGDGLLIKQGNKDEYKEYLIEQVAHQCVFNPLPQFVTTLHLTRGQEASPGTAAHAGPPQPAK